MNFNKRYGVQGVHKISILWTCLAGDMSTKKDSRKLVAREFFVSNCLIFFPFHLLGMGS